MKKSSLLAKPKIKSGIIQELLWSYEGGVVLLDSQGTIVSFNKGFCELTGEYDEKQLTGKNIKTIMHYKNDQTANGKIKKNKSKGIPEEIEMNLKTKKGEYIPIQISSFPVKDKKGFKIGSIAILEKIKKIKNLKSRLEKAVRVKDEKIQDLNTFIYKITHDLKSPLVNLEGLIQLIRKEKKEASRNQHLGIMQKSILRMQDMLGNLTILAENSQKELCVEEIDFDSLITEIKNEVSQLPDFRKISFCVKIGQKKIFRTDKHHLFTILMNLVNNSYKYRSSAFPFIHINIEEDEKGVKIEIKDNGIGIPDKLQDKIFDIFFRATEKSSGSGLGLYIVKTTVQKLHGKILVKSKENEGTTFTLLLPDLKRYLLTHDPI